MLLAIKGGGGNLKKKLFAILLTFSIFIVAGSYFVMAYPSTKLFDWDKNMNRKESVELLTSPTNLATAFDNLKVSLFKSIRAIDQEIESLLNREAVKSNEEIKNTQSEYKKDLDKHAEDLKQVNLDNYFDKTEIEKSVEEDFTNVLKDVLSEK